MRKWMIFLLAAMLLLTSGCTSETLEAPSVPEASIPVTEIAPTETPTEAPTEAPTEPVPTCVDAMVQVDDAPAILMLLNRGDQVDVVGEYDEGHYVIKTEAGYGLVEKQLLRQEGDTPYESWTGYARSKASVYTHYHLTGMPSQTLKTNTQVEVLDELDECYVVKVEDEICYMLKDQVSKNRIKGGGGNGSADGGDISLSYGGVVFLSAIEQSGDVTGIAEVLVNEAQVILGYFSRGDTAPMVAEEGFAPALTM